MSLIINKGLTIYNGISVGIPSPGHGLIVNIRMFVIKNYVRKIYLQYDESEQEFDVSGETSGGRLIFLKDKNEYRIILNIELAPPTNMNNDVLYEYFELPIRNIHNATWAITVYVKFYEDSYIKCEVDNRLGVWSKSNSYYLNIILNYLNNL